MGVEVLFYERVELVATTTEAEEDEHDLPDDCVTLYLDHPSRTQHDGMLQGFYRPSGKVDSLSATYSGYARWRATLARMLGTTAEAIWGDPRPGPFVELIDFADHAGVIGPRTAAKLARDFAEHRALAQSFAATLGDKAGWFLGGYDAWARALAVVGPEGAVRFD